MSCWPIAPRLATHAKWTRIYVTKTRTYFLSFPSNSANVPIYLANSIAAFSIRGRLWKMIEWHAMNRKRNEWLLIAGHLTGRCVTRRESRMKNMRAILDQLRKRRMSNGAWTQWIRSSIRTMSYKSFSNGRHHTSHQQPDVGAECGTHSALKEKLLHVVVAKTDDCN